jgi:MFS family permease
MRWLYRPGSVRLLWIGFLIVLAATVAAGFAVDMHPHFAFESLPAFFALFGFGACVVLVFGSKLLGVLLKRPDTYYDER